MNLAKKSQFHFTFIQVDSKNPKFHLEYPTVTLTHSHMEQCHTLKCYTITQSHYTLSDRHTLSRKKTLSVLILIGWGSHLATSLSHSQTMTLSQCHTVMLYNVMQKKLCQF